MGITAGVLGALGTIFKVASAAGAIATTTVSTVNAINSAQESKKMRKRMEGQAQSGISKVSPMTRQQLLEGNQSVLSSSNTATSTGRGRLLGN